MDPVELLNGVGIRNHKYKFEPSYQNTGSATVCIVFFNVAYYYNNQQLLHVKYFIYKPS